MMKKIKQNQKQFKKLPYLFVCGLLILFLLLRPALAEDAAADGLLLWFQALVPVLLPFFILSRLLISLDGVSGFTRLFYPVLHRLFGCSRNGCFCLAVGFLCGFPVGAKTAGDLTREGRISQEEGNYLLCFCNNVSPVFLVGYCMTESMKRPDLTGPALLLIFGIPLLFGLLTRKGRSFSDLHAEKKTSGSQISFKIVDACIMDGLESILKLGCYILLFSMLARLLMLVPLKGSILTCALTGALEITNGIALTAAQPALSSETACILTLTIAAFGGLSGIAQAQSMTQDSGLSLSSYIKAKLLTAALTAALSLLFFAGASILPPGL